MKAKGILYLIELCLSRAENINSNNLVNIGVEKT